MSAVVVNPKCRFPGCDRRYYAKGTCGTHYQQQRKGKPLTAILVKAPGGTGKIVDGYRLFYRPEHPNANKNGCVAEHTLVMSEILGRPLLPNEEVHHKNGQRLDNRPENLELWAKSQPAGQRVEDLLAWAYQLIETYEDGRGIAC